MPRVFRHLLVDAPSGLALSGWRLEAADLGLPGGWSVELRTLAGGQQDGVRVVTIDNGLLSTDLVLQRGLQLLDARFDGVRIGWNSPVAEVLHPAHLRLEERDGLGWLRGFNALLVRCGMTHNGPPCRDGAAGLRTLHGRVDAIPASFAALEVDLEPPHEIRLRASLFESGLFFENLRLDSVLATRPGEPRIRLRDAVTNLRGVPDAIQMLYHVNLGTPLLGPGARLLLPAERAVGRSPADMEGLTHLDRIEAPLAGRRERVVFLRLRADRAGMSRAALRNAAGDLAVSETFPRRALPCFTLWRQEGAEADGYVVGLEPGTNFPNPLPFERAKGRVARLGPGRTWRADLALEVHAGRRAVRALERSLGPLAGRNGARLEPPGKDWAPA